MTSFKINQEINLHPPQFVTHTVCPHKHTVKAKCIVSSVCSCSFDASCVCDMSCGFGEEYCHLNFTPSHAFLDVYYMPAILYPWIQRHKHWYQSATQLVVPITTEENTDQRGSAVPGWQASLVCTQSSQQWASSSSHSERSVFTVLFWSRGRTPPGPELIGWESCVPVASGKS